MLKKTIIILSLVSISCTSKEEIMKHPLDKSEVRKITLENGLRVYLLSDPDFNVSSASMSIDVGALEDPDNRLGLAHFLEHMLFLGTEKYPDVDDYGTYLKSNGGFSNAYTAGDHTNYHFEVLPDALEGALDRFSQFFINPLFTEEYTEREINAVHSEHQMFMMNDFWRTRRITKEHLSEKHPENRFIVGNLETLGDIEREELLSFYNKHYSSNRMGMSVLSTHGLDEMESWVRKYFSPIKNHSLSPNSYDPSILKKETTFRLIQIKPIKDLRELIISFALPGTRGLYKSKPDRQAGFIIGHEGPGSLLAYLKEKDWASSLSAGGGNALIYSDTRDYNAFTIRIGLTPKGLMNYKEVIKAVFNYTYLLKQSGYQHHVFNELKIMANLEDIYSNKGEGANRAIMLANEINMYPYQDAGKIRYIYEEDNPDAYNEYLSHLTPDNMIANLISNNVETDKVEHFYQASYSYTTDDSFYKELMVPVNQSELILPEKNLFIPKNASVPDRSIKKHENPDLLSDKKGTSVYFGVDHEFLRPKGVVDFKILFPKEKMNVKHRVYCKLFSACVNESLNELGYPAKQAGLTYSLQDGYEGIYLNVSGYQESSIILFEMIVDHLSQFSITETQFLAIKDKIIRDYKNFSLSEAYQQTRDKGDNIFQDVKYSWQECLPVADSATLEGVKEFGNELFQETFVEGLVYGDYQRPDAREIYRLFLEKTKTKGIKRKDAFELEYLDQPEAETLQLVDKLAVNNSCFYREYVLGNDSPDIRAASMIINKAIDQPFFTEMRTNQQLGYIVGAYTRTRDKTYTLCFLIQSGTYPADDLNQRADNYIKSLPDVLLSMTPDEFKQHRNSAIEKLEKKPMSIAERARKLKTLIFKHDSDYLRDQKTIDALKNINKETVTNILKNTISTKSRRMINVLSFAENHDNETNIESNIDDLKSWKEVRAYK